MIIMTQQEITILRVHKQTRNKLRKLALAKRESYDEIINRLLASESGVGGGQSLESRKQMLLNIGVSKEVVDLIGIIPKISHEEEKSLVMDAVRRRMSTKKEREIDAIKEKIVPTLKSNDVKRAAIFGSFANGTAKKTSDIDILVEFSKPKGLGFISLKLALEEKLKRKVDLLTYASINPYIRERVLKEAVRIL